MGCIYQRGKVYWIKYYRNGRPYCESTHSDREAAAKKFLKTREGEISRGELPGIHFDKVLFDDLAKDFLTDYENNKRKTIDKARIYVRHLEEFFGGNRIVDITTDRIRAFMQERINKDYENATINRHLSALKRMLTLGEQSRKVRDAPYVPMLKEMNVRQGFFEYAEFLAVRDALPDHLKPIITFAYHTGWRKGEILKLTWDRVDLKAEIIRLEPGETKNREAREIYLTGELLDAIRTLHSCRQLGCPHVFHLDGVPIKGFDKLWKKACREAGLKGKLFHDLRRTGVRNLIRSGVTERIAMTISGHKTRTVFDRYNIVSNQDLKEAAMKQQAFFEAQSHGERSNSQGEKVLPFRTVTETVTVAI